MDDTDDANDREAFREKKRALEKVRRVADEELSATESYTAAKHGPGVEVVIEEMGAALQSIARCVSDGGVDPAPQQIPTDQYHGVGPYQNKMGHGPLTLIAGTGVCLDCGYVASDIGNFHTVECDRRKNPVSVTWRELLLDNGEQYPEAAYKRNVDG
jgi:hypothetical protein